MTRTTSRIKNIKVRPGFKPRAQKITRTKVKQQEEINFTFATH